MLAARRKCGARTAWGTIPLLALGGCVTMHESEVGAKLPQLAAQLVVGETDRAAVQQALGKPWLTSDEWRFDLFRISDWDAGIVFLLYVPVPAANKEEGYVLVSYDPRGKVEAQAAGILISPLHFGNATQSLRLDAAGISLVVADDSERVLVLISPARRDAYLNESSPGNHCLLMVRCPYGNCGEWPAVEVDGVRSRLLPLPEVPGGLLWPERVGPGNHHLQVVERQVMSRDAVMASGTMRCESGEARYAIPPDYGIHGTREPIRVTRDLPETFREVPLLIWCDGTWLVPGES